MNKKGKILIITSTHGDEKIGLEVVQGLFKKGLSDNFDYLVANPFALIENKRYIETDLNRAYPGDINNCQLESKLAVKNLNIARQYDYIIDIHEACCGSDDFIIMPRAEVSNKFPLKYINLSTILFWPEPKGPMGGLLENVIELEFGMKNRDRGRVIEIATSVCEDFINNLSCGLDMVDNKKTVYRVYGSLLSSELPNSESCIFEDFKLAKIDNEEFYPLLVNQYIADGIVCYKMKKISYD